MSDAATHREPLVEEVLTGNKRELMLLAASGVLPLSPEDLIYVQVRLAKSDDGEIARRAAESLDALDPRQVVSHVKQEADTETLRHFAQKLDQPPVIEAILQRRDVPRDLMVEMASRLSPDMQEILLWRQDAILECTEILDSLEANPQLSSFSQRKIGEYRRHLLGPAIEPAESRREALEERTKEDAESAEAAEEASDDEVTQAIAEVTEEVDADGPVDERTGLSEGQIRALPVPIRVKLARGASRSLRAILIRDTNSTVALTVLSAGSLSDQEVEQVANSRNVLDDVLVAISRRREWIRKYAVVMALVKNPLTPMGISIRLLSRVAVRDLRSLARDKNVPEGVRSTALRMYQAKRQ